MAAKEKLLYEGVSLDTVLKIKYRLDYDGIPYRNCTKQTEGFIHLITQLFVSGRASRGMNDERSYVYQIYVAEEHFEKALKVCR